MKIKISKNRLRDLYKRQRLTTYEIANLYDCCQATVWKRLRKYRIKCLPNGRRSLIIPKSKLRDLYIGQRLSSRKIAKLYRCAYSAIDYKIKEYGFPVKTLAAAHITTLRKNFDGNKTDKAYLIGFAMGDLRVRKVYPNSETILIDCGSSKIEQINLIYKLFKPYGRVWVKKQPNRKGYIQIECSVNSSFDFLLKKRILADRWISKNKKYFWAFLAGFTDAEGCIAIDKRKNQAYYSLGNYNKLLLNQIRNYLIQKGISRSKLLESKVKGKLCFDKYFHNQNYWQLRIYKKDSLLTLFRLIGSHLKHAEKKKDMKIAKKNIALRSKLFGYRNKIK